MVWSGFVGRNPRLDTWLKTTHQLIFFALLILFAKEGTKMEKKDYIPCPTLHSYPNDRKLLGKMESTLSAAEVLTDIT